MIRFPAPRELPRTDGKQYPDTFSRMLRLHLDTNNKQADNAYLPFREVRQRWPLGFIVVGLAIASSVVYSLIF